MEEIRRRHGSKALFGGTRLSYPNATSKNMYIPKMAGALVKKERILFVTWDGPQVNYLETLFLPIFERLRESGFDFDILQFGWGDGTGPSAASAASKFRYRRVQVKRGMGPVGAFASAIAGSLAVKTALREFNSTMVMPRSILAGLTTAFLSRNSIPFVYDADGLMADEKVQNGLREQSLGHQALLFIERSMLRRADHITVRTRAAARILAQRGGDLSDSRFTVVSNGRNPEKFMPFSKNRREERAALGFNDADLVLVYCGSVGPQYKLPEIARLCRFLRQRIERVRLLVLTREIENALAALGEEGPFAVIRSAAASEVPKLLAASDIALAPRADSVAMSAVSPIKLGEYLLCGLPIIGNPRVGETEAASKAGVFIDSDCDFPSIEEWVHQFFLDRKKFRQKARKVGLSHFTIDRSVREYEDAITRARMTFSQKV